MQTLCTCTGTHAHTLHQNEDYQKKGKQELCRKGGYFNSEEVGPRHNKKDLFTKGSPTGGPGRGTHRHFQVGVGPCSCQTRDGPAGGVHKSLVIIGASERGGPSDNACHLPPLEHICFSTFRTFPIQTNQSLSPSSTAVSENLPPLEHIFFSSVRAFSIPTKQSFSPSSTAASAFGLPPLAVSVLSLTSFPFQPFGLFPLAVSASSLASLTVSPFSLSLMLSAHSVTDSLESK